LIPKLHRVRAAAKAQLAHRLCTDDSSPVNSNLAKLRAGYQRYGALQTLSGLVQLARLQRGKGGEASVTTRGSDLRFSFDNPRQLIRTLVVFRELVEPEYDLVRRLLSAGSLFVDVGGGIGTYSVLAARLTGARVHTFEPVPQNAATIERNVARNGVADLVTVHRAAVADYEGFGRMTDPENLFLGSLEEDAGTDGRRSATEGSLRVTTLGAFASEEGLDRLDMVKIDVEGREPAVIEGAWALIERDAIPAIILEWNQNSRPMYKRLSAAGYDLFRYDIDMHALVPADPDSGATSREGSAVFESNVVAIARSEVPLVRERLAASSAT
jgi:FkbM family methyltransferase